MKLNVHEWMRKHHPNTGYCSGTMEEYAMYVLSNSTTFDGLRASLVGCTWTREQGLELMQLINYGIEPPHIKVTVQDSKNHRG